MPDTPLNPGNREPSIEKAIDDTKRPLRPTDPILDPGKPVGPNDGPMHSPDPSAPVSDETSRP